MWLGIRICVLIAQLFQTGNLTSWGAYSNVTLLNRADKGPNS